MTTWGQHRLLNISSAKARTLDLLRCSYSILTPISQAKREPTPPFSRGPRALGANLKREQSFVSFICLGTTRAPQTPTRRHFAGYDHPRRYSSHYVSRVSYSNATNATKGPTHVGCVSSLAPPLLARAPIPMINNSCITNPMYAHAPHLADARLTCALGLEHRISHSRFWYSYLGSC